MAGIEGNRDVSGLRMELTEVSGGVVLTLSGRGETTDGARLQSLVDRVAGMKPPLVVVDLRKVEFFGSYGVNELVRLDKAMEGWGGQVRLAEPPPLITDLLRRAHLGERFGVYESVEEALG